MHVFTQLLVEGLSIGAIYALIALGYTMVYGALRLINFAHGDVYMVGAAIAYWLATWIDDKPLQMLLKYLVIFGGAMAGCAVLGYLIERFCYRPLRNRPRLISLITSIGVSLFLENLFQLQHPKIFGPGPHYLPESFTTYSSFTIHGITINSLDLITLGLCLALMLGMMYLVLWTRTGLAIRAISFRADTAALMGVRIDHVIAVTFMLGSALAAVAGVVDAMRYPVEPLMGLTAGIKAFIAAVLGGIGSIPGALLGGLLMGLVETFLKGYLPGSHSGYADAAAYAILILVLVVRPAGLMGKLEPEKV